MKKVLGWIFGIFIGLAIIAIIVGAGFMITRRLGGVAWMSGSRLVQRNGIDRSAPNQLVPRQRNRGGMMPGFNEQNEMPMYYYGRTGFRPFGGLMLIGGLIGGLFKLALLGLVIFFAVTLGLRYDRNKRQAALASPTAAASVEKMACPSCAREVQVDWKHCPYCGNSLEATEPETPVT
jgi:hypothetical protein